MPYNCRILKDSISPLGPRLTTMEVSYPRFVHSEMLTHRDFSRNAASSRAIPISKMIDKVIHDCAYPIWWGKNQSGMQALEELDTHSKEQCIIDWNIARDNAIKSVESMMIYGCHKQIANRLLEPFMFITVIITATNWNNFFTLRCHPDAQPEIKHIAEMMRKEYNTSKPELLKFNQWHLPLIQEDEKDLDIELLKKISVARCARVSYLTHSGKRDNSKDLELYERLFSSKHMSPFEHVATPSYKTGERSGNLVGFIQFRKTMPEEYSD